MMREDEVQWWVDTLVTEIRQMPVEARIEVLGRVTGRCIDDAYGSGAWLQLTSITNRYARIDFSDYELPGPET
jgi:hypothetical protein